MVENVKPDSSIEEEFKLFNLTDVDRATLRQTDEQFVPHDWEELKTIVGKAPNLNPNNDLDLFKRYPTQLRRYLHWSRDVKSKYGGIVNFVCRERLRWASSSTESITPVSSTPFANASDYKILRNDWPYAVASDIAHIVVWLKPRFQTDSEGRVLPESRGLIGEFVGNIFVGRLREKHADAADRVLWFKNWSALQSVGALEHFHVLVRGAGEDLLWEWTAEGPRTTM